MMCRYAQTDFSFICEVYLVSPSIFQFHYVPEAPVNCVLAVLALL